MTTLLIIALILFVVGLILVLIPDGRLFRVGTALALIGLAVAVFLPGLLSLR